MRKDGVSGKAVFIRRILLVVTVVILIISIIAAGSLYIELKARLQLPVENTMPIDGADFSGILNLFGYMAIGTMPFLLLVSINLVSAVLWAVYGISLLAYSSYCRWYRKRSR